MTRAVLSPERLASARAAAEKSDVDVLLITAGADLRWLTGYDALPLERLTCLVLPVGAQPFLVAPALEVPAVHASPAGSMDLEVVGWTETEDPYAVIADRLGRGIDRIALSNQMWAEQVLRFREVLPEAEQSLAADLLADLRMRKSPEEIDALRRAGAAIDRVHARMAEFLSPGRTERDAGREIATAIIDEGHVGVDFVIVASGPNGASPHHELSDRTIEAGDPVVVDIGGTTAEGYCSDCTRMYTLGEPPPEFTSYFRVLHDAQLAACAQARPGVTAESVDAAARNVIEAGGFGDSFIHRTGHGIGVESHEQPYIVAGNQLPLEPGMVFSIEPGIYQPGRSGARIEDIVVCTDTGIERLNTTDRDYVVLGVG